MAKEALARERLFALRETIARMEGRPLSPLDDAGTPLAPGGQEEAAGTRPPERLPLGVPLVDEALSGGLPAAGMAEIRTAELRDAGASTGLALSLCAFLARQAEGTGADPAFLFIGERKVALEAGEPFAPGLADHGLGLRRLFHAAPRRLEEALWLAEAALSSRAFRAVVLEIAGNPRRFGLGESRRLSLRARHAGSLLLLLRQGGGEEAGSTLFRLEASPSRSGHYRLPDGRMLGGTIGAPGFAVRVEKASHPALSSLPQAIAFEWIAHERLFALPDASLPPVRNPAGPAHPGARLPAPADRPDRAQALGAVLAFSRAS
ncbi:hypothetical protein [Gellertiella hungarica]|uniref:Protein ImuA n=1 Tax=Gellertiella hungarica TaxID=1572859 RepID=A0A7W6NL28_9HYPH|nr:hypothetical protein [Gellertiella hungarica]MBB4065468.1 protein ImuA [Gellertiella hungarica]